MYIVKRNSIAKNIRHISYHKAKNWYANLVKTRPAKPPFKHVAQIGDPTLRLVADPIPVVDINTEPIQHLIRQLEYVFKKYNCIGMSAPQIGVPLRIIIIEFSMKHMKSYSKEEVQAKEISVLPRTVLVNPEVTITDYNKIVYPESCESIKGYWADVPRYRSLMLKGLNKEGDSIHLTATGWTSRIIQHEMDHLNGKLYTDIMDRRSLTCGCWETINDKNGKVNLPFGPD